MRETFSDGTTFLKLARQIRGGLFAGPDLAFDKAAGTLRLRVTCPENEQAGGLRSLLPRRPSWRIRVLEMTGVLRYRQSLTGGLEEVYAVDRCEVERSGTEITLYFRPGDRAVIEVDAIHGTLTDSGRATAIPKKPRTHNPLLAEEGRKGRR